MCRSGREDVLADLSARVETARRQVAPFEQRPRCVLVEWVDPLFCAGHWGPELVEIAGGFDPLGRKHERSVQMSWEQVIDAQPEVMVLALCGYDVARARLDFELLRLFPGFESLPAARDGRVYAVDASALFARPGPQRIVDSTGTAGWDFASKEFPEFVESTKSFA